VHLGRNFNIFVPALQAIGILNESFTIGLEFAGC
jgi:hypothetical protein